MKCATQIMFIIIIVNIMCTYTLAYTVYFKLVYCKLIDLLFLATADEICWGQLSFQTVISMVLNFNPAALKITAAVVQKLHSFKWPVWNAMRKKFADLLLLSSSSTAISDSHRPS